MWTSARRFSHLVKFRILRVYCARIYWRSIVHREARSSLKNKRRFRKLTMLRLFFTFRWTFARQTCNNEEYFSNENHRFLSCNYFSILFRRSTVKFFFNFVFMFHRTMNLAQALRSRRDGKGAMEKKTLRDVTWRFTTPIENNFFFKSDFLSFISCLRLFCSRQNLAKRKEFGVIFNSILMGKEIAEGMFHEEAWNLKLMVFFFLLFQRTFCYFLFFWSHFLFYSTSRT